MHALKVGTTLHQDAYRIEGVLGQGGFGITYLATDFNLQRMVAIKEFFPKNYCEREDNTSHVILGTKSMTELVNRLKAKFLKEARNIAKLDNSAIIRIHAAFEENNTAYYVMDYIEGESLSGMVRLEGPLPVDRALRYLRSVGEALTYVHERNINHLDVKPANIIVRREDDRAILIDFGLSKQYDSEGKQTSTTPTGISHGFAPLEQYNYGGVKEFSPQTDIYSLAATLYYLLSGIVPPQATMLVDEELTFPPGIPIHLVDPLFRAMSSRRKNRQSSVMEFLHELENVELETSSVIIASSLSEEMEEPMSDKEKAKELLPEQDMTTNSESDKKTNLRKISNFGSYKIWGIIIVALIAVGALLLIVLNIGDGAYEKENNKIFTVSDMEWVSPLGISKYTGEVHEVKQSDGKISLIPHGRGIATITEGDYNGCIYDGTFESGTMEGETTYTRPGGDVFIGRFHNNQYDYGKYVDASSDEYFIGTFKDMEPAKGSWYTVDGKFIEQIGLLKNN